MDALEQYKSIEGHNFEFNPTKCTWAEVVEELNKAHAATYHSEQRNKTLHGRVWKTATNTSKIIQPALEALPSELSILHGGLAVVFNVSRITKNHSRDSTNRNITARAPPRKTSRADFRYFWAYTGDPFNGLQQV